MEFLFYSIFTYTVFLKCYKNVKLQKKIANRGVKYHGKHAHSIICHFIYVIYRFFLGPHLPEYYFVLCFYTCSYGRNITQSFLSLNKIYILVFLFYCFTQTRKTRRRTPCILQVTFIKFINVSVITVHIQNKPSTVFAIYFTAVL